MSGDYRIELGGNVSACLISWEPFDCEADTRDEIRRRQRIGDYGCCSAYVRNVRTGWRSAEVKPLRGER